HAGGLGRYRRHEHGGRVDSCRAGDVDAHPGQWTHYLAHAVLVEVAQGVLQLLLVEAPDLVRRRARGGHERLVQVSVGALDLPLADLQRAREVAVHAIDLLVEVHDRRVALLPHVPQDARDHLAHAEVAAEGAPDHLADGRGQLRRLHRRPLEDGGPRLLRAAGYAHSRYSFQALTLPCTALSMTSLHRPSVRS